MLAHQRLAQGPISLTYLVAPIESAINRELDGLRVRIDDAVVSRAPNGEVRFRLQNLALSISKTLLSRKRRKRRSG